MAEFTVWFTTTASSVVTINDNEVDLDGLDLTDDDDRDTARERIEDAAWQKLNTTLCHQCVHHLDLGDFEPEKKITGFDADDED